METLIVSPSLSGRMRASLLGHWRQARPVQRFAYLVGGGLILAGLAHLVVWLAVGGPWQGPISFRKPTTFGISFGLTTITLAWVTGHLRLADRTRWLLLGSLAAADTYEVAWVATQRWRGVASHFNQATTADYALFLLGAAAIAVTVSVILVLTMLAFTAMQAAPSMAVAVRVGLLVLLVAQGVGGWMIGHGVGPASDGVTEGLTTFRAAGVMKVPHAVAMHAIQVLPALVAMRSPEGQDSTTLGLPQHRGCRGWSSSTTSPTRDDNTITPAGDYRPTRPGAVQGRPGPGPRQAGHQPRTTPQFATRRRNTRVH